MCLFFETMSGNVSTTETFAYTHQTIGFEPDVLTALETWARLVDVPVG
jgi:hypothetical protein